MAMERSRSPNTRSLNPQLAAPLSQQLDGTSNQQTGRTSTNLTAQISVQISYQTLRSAYESQSDDSRRGSRNQFREARSSINNKNDAPDTMHAFPKDVGEPLDKVHKHGSTHVDDSPDHLPAAEPKNIGSVYESGPQLEQAPGPVRSQSRPKLRYTQSSTLSAPRSVRDLGSDYTRYYNPFETRNNSQTSLATPLPINNLSRQLARTAVSSPDLERRLIDPLGDLGRTRESTPINRASLSTIQAKKSDQSLSNSSLTTDDTSENIDDAFILDTPDSGLDQYAPYIDDRLNAPWALPLFTTEKEDDDEMHLPRWDDDIKYKAHWRDRFNAANIINSIGGVMVVLGLSCLFVALPVISWTGTSILAYPYDSPTPETPVDPWTYVNNRKYPLLRNVRTGLIDFDTPRSAMTRKSIDGSELRLVFSDEFNLRNRTFYPGDDPYWFAPDVWYGATQDLEWYDPDAVNTGGGTLQLQLDQFPNHGLGFRSGMLNSWNQMCFKGGVFEVSMSLPGPAGTHGLWPGVWSMGNLGRPGYLSTTDGLWPYTYNGCDVGITPNQSMTDGTSFLPGQRLPACTCSGADHPTPGTGRGAPEIDIAEVSADYGGLGVGVATQSFQVAPFDIWYYPNYNFMETPNYNISFVNTYTGGPYQQAVSTTSMLNNNWYDGKQYQKFAYEYTPGSSADAGITWFIGEEETMRFDARAIGVNGNIGQRIVSEEPMSIILNLGISNSWTYIDWNALKFPAVLRVDYVRIYQPKDAKMVTCDPPGYETTEYIANHPEAYKNPNYTRWVDAGYEWPRNTLMDFCSA